MLESEYIWSTTEQSKKRLEALNIISMLVSSYGGTAEVDMENETIEIDFPDTVSKEQEIDCAEKIERIMLEAGFCI